jgi:hypothetical protein
LEGKNKEKTNSNPGHERKQRIRYRIASALKDFKNPNNPNIPNKPNKPNKPDKTYKPNNPNNQTTLLPLARACAGKYSRSSRSQDQEMRLGHILKFSQ